MSRKPAPGMRGMRELGKSALRFSLAMAMNALQQVIHLLTPPRASDPFRSTLESLDMVSGAMEGQLGTPLRVTQMLGDGLQRSVVDLVASGLGPVFPAPSVSAGIGRRRTEESMRNLTPRVVAGIYETLGVENVSALEDETRNKVALDRIISGIFDIAPESVHEDLHRHVEEARRRPAEEIPWALLALGRLWVARELDVDAAEGKDGRAWSAAVASEDRLFFQIGIATELATRRCRDLRPWTPPSQIRKLLERQAADVRGLTLPGHERLGAEALGRALADGGKLELLQTATPRLRALDPRGADATWHGAGRASYFSPHNFTPDLDEPWPGLRRCVEGAPDEHAAHRMAAGFVFALVTVNAASPEVTIQLLRSSTRRGIPGVRDGLVAGLKALAATLGGREALAEWNRQVQDASGEAESLVAAALAEADRLPEPVEALVIGS